MQTVTSYYPALMVKNVAELKDYFVEILDFEVVYDSDWYVHLSKRNQKNINLAFVKYDHESIPKESRKIAQGILLNLEIDNVENEYDRIKNTVSIEMKLKEEAWGQKHFIIKAPGNILIDIIKVIPPSKEFEESYV